MSNQQISELSALLSESHTRTHQLFNKVDPELIIYADPDWRVLDVIWHIAVWDRQVTRSIEAFQAGGEYAIPDFDEQSFNQATVQECQELSQEQVIKGSNQARQGFISAVERFNADQLEVEFLYPWGDEMGNIIQLVNYMVEHDEEHRQEINSSTGQQ